MKRIVILISMFICCINAFAHIKAYPVGTFKTMGKDKQITYTESDGYGTLIWIPATGSNLSTEIFSDDFSHREAYIVLKQEQLATFARLLEAAINRLPIWDSITTKKIESKGLEHFYCGYDQTLLGMNPFNLVWVRNGTVVSIKRYNAIFIYYGFIPEKGSGDITIMNLDYKRSVNYDDSLFLEFFNIDEINQLLNVIKNSKLFKPTIESNIY